MQESQSLAREAVADEGDHAGTGRHYKLLADRRALRRIGGGPKAIEIDAVVDRDSFLGRETEFTNQIVANEIRHRDHSLQAGSPERLPLDEHLHLMIRADTHRSRAERAAPFSRRAEITGMSAAAGAHHVRADASRKTQHQIGSCAARRGRCGPRESQQGQRASEPGTAADATDIPVAGRTADLVGENRNLMTRCAQTIAP